MKNFINLSKMKLILSLAFIIAVAPLCSAQNIITYSNGKKYYAKNIYLLHNQVVFSDTTTKTEIIAFKKAVKSVLFSDGLSINYTISSGHSSSGYNYNCTINMVDGSYFVAEILRITADSISYLYPEKKDTLFISPQKIIEINYLNGVNEHFTTNDYAYSKTVAALPPKRPLHTSNSSVFYTGFMAGITKSKLRLGSSADNTKSHNGFVMGITTFYDFAKSGSLNFCLQYESKGLLQNSDSVRYKIDLNYLELPINYQLQFGFNQVRFFGDVGFYFAYLIHAKEILQMPAYTTSNNITNKLHKVDGGYCIGFGIKYFTKTRCFIAGFRNDIGVSNIAESYASYNEPHGINGSNIWYVGYTINISEYKQQHNK